MNILCIFIAVQWLLAATIPGFTQRLRSVAEDRYHSPLHADTTIRDYDGNRYGVLAIGSQIWTTENLRTTHYANGDSILNIAEATDWSSATLGAWCYYDNEPGNQALYGKLYNGYAVADRRGLAPRGWHVATADDYYKLIEFLGGPDLAGSKLKATTGWKDGSGNDANGTNTSGFNARPGGNRRGNGSFMFDTNMAAWYTSVSDAQSARLLVMTVQYDPPASIGPSEANFGYSIRLVKDDSSKP